MIILNENANINFDNSFVSDYYKTGLPAKVRALEDIKFEIEEHLSDNEELINFGYSIFKGLENYLDTVDAQNHIYTVIDSKGLVDYITNLSGQYPASNNNVYKNCMDFMEDDITVDGDTIFRYNACLWDLEEKKPIYAYGSPEKLEANYDDLYLHISLEICDGKYDQEYNIVNGLKVQIREECNTDSYVHPY